MKFVDLSSLIRPCFFYLLCNEPSSSRFLKMQIKIKIRFHVFLFPPIQNFTQTFFLCRSLQIVIPKIPLGR